MTCENDDLSKHYRFNSDYKQFPMKVLIKRYESIENDCKLGISYTDHINPYSVLNQCILNDETHI